MKGARYLIVDRDALFSEPFQAILQSAEVGIVRAAIQAPNMNAFAEGLARTKGLQVHGSSADQPSAPDACR